MARFVDQADRLGPAGDVRDVGVDLPDLPGDPQRRPGVPAGGQVLDARTGRVDPQGVGLRQADLRPVRQDDGEDLRRVGDLLHPAAQRRPDGHPRSPGDALGDDRRRRDLAAVRRAVRRPLGDPRRTLPRPRADGARVHRGLDAGLLPRRHRPLLPRLQGQHLPARRLRPPDAESRRLVRRTCCCRGSRWPSSTSASTRGSFGRACSTRSARTTFARPGPRASPSGASSSATPCATA